MLTGREKRDLVISWITLSVAFAWTVNFGSFLEALPAYLVIVGTAFVLHELAHKFAAVRLGYPAEYRMWEFGLVMALGLAVLTGGRFIFAAPGAVYVLGMPNLRDNGRISLAGPVTNLVIAYLFLSFALFLDTTAFVREIFLKIAVVNGFIGFFNMLPVPPLDGSKVFAWNPFLYFLVLLGFYPFISVL